MSRNELVKFNRFIALVALCLPAPELSWSAQVDDCATRFAWLSGEARTVEAIERTLAESEIDLRTRVPVGTGVMGAERVSLAEGTSVLMKRPLPQYGMRVESEVAAYRLDRFLGGGAHVPVTVKRSLGGEVVSLQYFVKDAQHVTGVGEQEYRRILYFFDFLIDNTDRSRANLLRTGDGAFVAIDHGHAFRSEFAEANPFLMGVKKENAWSMKLSDQCAHLFWPGFSESCVKQIVLRSLPPRDLYEKVRDTPAQVFRELFAGLLTPKEVDAFLKRRDVFVQTVEKWLGAGHPYP